MFYKGAEVKSYDELAANIAAVEKIGTWIAMSKMFGDMTVNQGCIIAADCFITGVSLLDYQRRNQLVGGRPNIPYDAMLAAFQERGGAIKIIQRDADGCRIELSYKGQTTPFALLWENAQKEAFVYGGVKDMPESKILDMLASGKKPPIKPKYATPRSRTTMLFARCVSDAIRSVAPEVNFGRYTPEEIEDFSEPTDKSSPSPVANVAPTTAPAVAVTQPAIQAKPETAEPPAPATIQPVEDTRTTVKLDGPAQPHQREAAIKLMEQLALEGFTDVVAKFKGKLAMHAIEGGVLGLTVSEADSLIEALKLKQLERWIINPVFGHKAKAAGSYPS